MSTELTTLTEEAQLKLDLIASNPTNQRIFVEYYSRSKNAAHAVWLGGWAPKVGLESVYLGMKFLQQDLVIETLYAIAPTEIMAPQEVLARLSSIATTTFEDFIEFNPDGTYVISLRRAQMAAKLGSIKKIKHTKFGVEIELYDALAALKLLGAHQGLFQQAVRRDDWRGKAIEDIRAGLITYDALMEAFQDIELVTELFREAGVSTPKVIQGGKKS